MSTLGIAAAERGVLMRHLGGNPVSLNGDWAFQLVEGPDAPAAGPWRDMSVPSLWTRQGTTDLPQYTNIRMPFPEQPPYTPAANPTGVYEREFQIPDGWTGQRVILRVGGFEGRLRVWVNDTFIGEATDGRLAADFAITQALQQGSNRLRLRVSKWSATTFIEDQDQWWHGGISRDVQLFSTPLTHVSQLYITPGLDGQQGTLRVRGQIDFADGRFEEGHTLVVRIPALGLTLPVQPSGGQPDASLTAADHALAVAWERSEFADAGAPPEVIDIVQRREPAMAGSFDATFQIPGIAPWSAEAPQLYDLVVEHQTGAAVAETFAMRVGFRRVQVVGTQLLVNDAPVTIHGVNRHDFHPVTGRVLTYADMREDLLELKRWNVNAIRTSHYPNDPVLLDLADELGFYVVEEANIESHAHMHSLCDDPRYLAEFVQRVSRMVQRDIHHACVILWSLGNESGYGANHDAAAAWVRRFDPTRPLHYEGAIRGDWSKGHAASDVICPMYPSIDAIVRHATSGRQDRPLIMCEYSHAMGNSNGSLRDYWEAIEQHPGLQGGFIWEMWDHGLDQLLPDGRLRSAYGGDFGEVVHDGNFCCDGLFSPRRAAKPVMHEFKAIAAPVRVRHIEGDRFTVHNRQWFAGTEDFDLEWEAWLPNGERAHGRLPCPAVPPRAARDVTIPVADALLLNVRVLRRTATPWAAAGSEVAWEQFSWDGVDNVAALMLANLPSGRQLPVEDDILRSAEISLWRAPTDNDRFGGVADRWQQWGLRDLHVVAAEESVEDGVTVIRRVLETAAGIRVPHERRIRHEAGAVHVTERIELPEVLDDVARVGTVLALPRPQRVAWFGVGPYETYPDRRWAPLGAWESDLQQMQTAYLRPQENGGRSDVHWMSLRADGESWLVEHHAPCQMSVSSYGDAQLADAAHLDELRDEATVTVHVDARHRGLGTASCGPDILPQYRIPTGAHTWSWRLSHSLSS